MRRSYCKAVIRSSQNRLRKDGTTQVLIYYHHHSTIYFNTKIWIRPKHWLKKAGLVSDKCDLGSPEKINDKIENSIEEIDNLIKIFKQEYFRLPNSKELLGFWYESRSPQIISEYNFLNDFKNWIWSQRNSKSKGSIKIYEQTYRYLKNFFTDKYGNLMPDSVDKINLIFLESFRDWMGNQKSRATKKNVSNTTINKQIRNVHKFLRDSSKKGIKINTDAFNIQLDKRYSPKVFLTESEIQSIIQLDISLIKEDQITFKRKRTLTLVKDIFIVNIFFGLRVNDLLNLQKHSIHFSDSHDKDNYIIILTQKTDHQAKLPILDEKIKLILRKYIDNNPSENLFPKISVHSYNHGLKLLSKYAGITSPIAHDIYSNGKRISNLLPKWKKISSHSIRKSSINRNIIDHGRDVAKYISTHKSEGGFAPYEELTDYDKIFDKIKKQIENG